MSKPVLFDLNRALDIWEGARKKVGQIVEENGDNIDRAAALIESLLIETVRLAGTAAISIWQFLAYTTGQNDKPPIFERKP